MKPRRQPDVNSFVDHAVALQCTPLRSLNRPLVNEPLSVEDWGEVHNAYLAFLANVRLVVAKARARVGAPVEGS